MTEDERAARHWEKLAAEKREWAEYAKSRGEYAGVFLTQARTYDRAAKAIRLTEATGVVHCSCHLIPVTEARALHDRPA
jgi:hypothetical protein